MRRTGAVWPRRRARSFAGALLLGVGGWIGAAPLDAQPTRQVRPDSARVQILERLRAAGRPLSDTLSADTLRSDDPAQAGAPLGISMGRPGDPSRVPLPPGADSTMQALFELPGFTIATYQAVRADFDAGTRRLLLTSDDSARAQFSGRGVRLQADSSIVYDDALGIVRTTGRTHLIPDSGEPVESHTLIYDVSAARGTALGARTIYSEGANWIVEADMDWVSDGLLFGTNARFTSCDLEVPHSYFEARELKVVGGQVLVARSVQMYVADVPVMWLPFIAQNLGSGRASGILTPSFSVNDIVRTSTGYNRRVSNLGYYWAMSDYSDATLAMDWWANNYTGLSGSLRYRWARQFLNGEVAARRYWREGGGQELSFRTRHSWEISERTRARVNASYVSSTAFVTRNTFDPTELNQTIDSDGGIDHRFDWGSMSLSANRRQYLSDDRVDLTLPSFNMSLSTLTLLDAPAAQASWYNNISLGGSMSWTRNVNERAFQPDSVFTFQQASQVRTRGNASGRIGVGNLNLGTRVELEETEFEDVPGRLTGGGDLLNGVGRSDFRTGRVGWSTSLSYQQRLIGNSSITPSISLGGELRRVDSIPEARDFVSGPERMSLGVGAQTELYGFYPGFGSFEAIRHKVTPNMSYSWSPEVTPNELQARVFGARVARPTRLLTLGFNQTWEARVTVPEEPDPPPGTSGDAPSEEGEPQEEPETAEEEAAPPPFVPPARERDRDDEGGPRRLPQSQVVTLLALQTSAITYDMVEADSTGFWLDGFTTTRLHNTVRSDYMRGLDLSFEHDLFTDSGFGSEEPRSFSPHLSQLSLGFAVSDQSGFVRLLGRLLGVEAPEPVTRDAPGQEIPPDSPGGFFGGPDQMDPSRVSAGPGSPSEMGFMGPRRREGWDARIRYSLRRPREDASATVSSALRSQMVQGSLSFSPSEFWTADWNTSYDLETNRFLDHMVSLRRDLHEWEATFGFRQTATGNWQFQFEVSLKANRDLRFDYEQRSLDPGGSGQFPVGGGPF